MCDRDVGLSVTVVASPRARAQICSSLTLSRSSTTVLDPLTKCRSHAVRSTLTPTVPARVLTFPTARACRRLLAARPPTSLSLPRTTLARRLASTEAPAAGASPQPPYRPTRAARLFQTIGRITLFAVVTSGGLLYYVAYKDRTPGPQLPPDPTKKNLVILGSGWGATSLLDGLDTTDYNVVSTSVVSFRGCALTENST